MLTRSYYLIRLLIGALLALAAPSLICAKSGEVTEHFLANGLKILIKEDHRAPIAVAQIWYKVGSSYETAGITGVSHALEHMMFRGTKKYEPGKLDKIIVANGGIHNAFTSHDYTTYYAVLAANKLALVFDLEADRMQGVLLDKEKVWQKERQVIIEERKLRIEDDPNSLAFERFQAAAFTTNPYRHPVIGWMHDIHHLTQKDLRAWYQNWYAPNNAILVVVGDVQPAKVLALAKQYFGKIPPASILQPKPQPEIPALGERQLLITAPAKLPYLIMGYNVPTLKTASHSWQAYALEVIQSILSHGASARLDKELVRTQQIAASIGVSYNLYSRLDDLFSIDGTPAIGHTAQELKQAILQQIAKLQSAKVSINELERVKTQLIASKIYAKDSIVMQAKEIGSLEAVGLSWRVAEEYVQKIKAITPEQICQVAKEYLTLARLTTAELQPLNVSANAN